MATDDAVLKELQNADERIISMQAAADERNSISYILGKCIHEKPYHVAIILKNLTQRISQILPEVIKDLDNIFSSISITGNKWGSFNHHSIAERCISVITNRVLFGHKLANDQEFLDSVIELSNTISRAGLPIDLAPRPLKYILAHFLVPKQGAFQVYLSKVGPMFEERRRAYQEYKGDQGIKPVCIFT